ncbi:glyoxylase-like metal-dependent hydrolase (beta-lactamase superfamily II) [Alkalibacillus flavidus]|uniref:Glyoxylase-like metal-dependent hydrolase (Beta-lactamase superfamily II) n=1 Tax=Alkalibacillus flavidus TaxID=546021 RepID=A0ABV2KS38_9BACI
MAENLYQITMPTPYAVGDVHSYVLIDDVVTLFDAGVDTDDAWQAMVRQLSDVGLTPSDIDQIVLTHHHPDHTGLIHRFDDVQAIYGHAITNLWLNQESSYFDHYRAFFAKLYDQFGVPETFRKVDKTINNAFRYQGKRPVTHIIDEGDTIPSLEDWSIIETKGHAQSHLSFLRQTDGTLISGDHLLKHISSNPILEAPLEGEVDRPKPLLNYRRTLTKLQSLDIQSVLPGHGDIFDYNSKLIQHRLTRQEERAQKVLDYVLEHRLEATPFNICQFLFPKHYEKQFGLTMSETIGQLDYLEASGDIEAVYSKQVLTYKPTKQSVY